MLGVVGVYLDHVARFEDLGSVDVLGHVGAARVEPGAIKRAVGPDVAGRAFYSEDQPRRRTCACVVALDEIGAGGRFEA